MAWLRLIALLFLLETVFFLLLRLYVRSLRREKLETLWDRKNPTLVKDHPRRARFVETGMTGFEKTLRMRLLWLVFILPTLTVMGIIIWVNWQ